MEPATTAIIEPSMLPCAIVPHGLDVGAVDRQTQQLVAPTLSTRKQHVP